MWEKYLGNLSSYAHHAHRYNVRTTNIEKRGKDELKMEIVAWKLNQSCLCEDAMEKSTSMWF